MSAGPRLELTWPGKEKFLLSPKDHRGEPIWVERTHPAVTEVRVTEFTSSYGDVNGSSPHEDNLLFTGDSLDVLRILADAPEYRQRYRGKVKLCYIDPPFNTGQAFANYDDWMEHSTWLSFMRDRLVLIRELLASDGSVWVHLDDTEVHRMRSLMDEVFGAGCFVATIIWQKSYSPRNDAGAFSTDQDYILVYGKGSGWAPNRWERLESRDALYRATDGDERVWVSGDPAAPGGHTHQGMVYGIQSPFTGKFVYPAKGRHWSQEQSAMKALVEEWGVPYRVEDIHDEAARARVCGLTPETVRAGVGALVLDCDLEEARDVVTARHAAGSWPRLYWTRGGQGGLKLKRYLDEISSTRSPQTLWFHDEVGHSRSAKHEIGLLFPDVTAFATPKPERLLQRILDLGSGPGDVVLDCFVGSGTTAAVAHKMGRRWVACEVNEDTVSRFVVPRLRRVVDGEDLGGVSTTTRRVGAAGSLPEGVSAEQAREFSTLLTRVVKAVESPVDADTIKALRAATRTREEVTQDWDGGGGFRQVEVGPSMYEVTPVGVMLADWATNGLFARAVAGQLGFEWQTEEHAPFCGVNGRMRLAVFDGVVGPEEARHVIGALTDKERVTIVAKAVLPGVEDLVRDLSKGSRVRKAPRDLLEAGAARARRRMEGTVL